MTNNLIGSLELNRIYQRDCLEGMSLIPDKSIDMILCDLPYGTTEAKWDTVIPFEPLWKQYKRIIKDNGAIVLTGQEPFSSLLRVSNLKMYKYDWVWDKVAATGFLNAKKIPLKQHENVSVFYKKLPTYNPQMVKGKKWSRGGKGITHSDIYVMQDFGKPKSDTTDMKYPKTIITISNADKTKHVHPTQKPVELFQYLIETYSNPGMIVLDNCMGSGTTAVAAVRTGRNFIGFETEPSYVEIANKRLDNELEAR
jgi:site-specific DNA-methyltransferase (adenine-specific)